MSTRGATRDPGRPPAPLLSFRLLGPLEVDDRGRRIALARTKERTLLALLLLRANAPVSRDRLIDELWGEHPPETAKHTLEAYVSRLRKTLAVGANGRIIESEAGGYLIRLDPEQLDSYCFERLLEEAQAALARGAAGDADEKLRAALSLWRGDVLADLVFEPLPPVEVARLEELRLVATEARFESALALGRHDALVAELRSLVARHPLRERLRGQLMLALYRCGRQAEALEVYEEGRTRLAEELGLDPGPKLRGLQAAILRQDPELAAPRPVVGGGRSGADAASAGRPRVPRRTQRSWTIAAAGVAVIVVGTALATLRLHDDAGILLTPNTVGVIDAATDTVVARVSVGREPTGIAAEEDAIWVVNRGDGTVTRIDPMEKTVVATIPVARAGETGSLGDIAAGDGPAWLVRVAGGETVLDRIEPAFNTIAASVQLGEPAVGWQSRQPIAFGEGAVWLAAPGGKVLRVDPVTMGRLDAFESGLLVTDLAVGGGAAWAASRSAVARLYPDTDGAAARIQVGAPVMASHFAAAIAIGDDAAWVTLGDDDAVARVDGVSRAVSTTPVSEPVDVAVGKDAVWVASRDGTVSRIDPETRQVVAVIQLGVVPAAIAVAGQSVWVTGTWPIERSEGR